MTSFQTRGSAGAIEEQETADRRGGARRRTARADPPTS
jgi:hypothetical protein